MRSLYTITFLLLLAVASAQPVSYIFKKKEDGKSTFRILLQRPQSKQYVFTHFNSVNGVVSNLVKGIRQDAEGFIWMATIDGLQRYDGNKFLTFRNRPNDPKSLASDDIRQIEIDAEGNLWILADQFLGMFDRHTFSYTNYVLAKDSAGLPMSVAYMKLDANRNCLAVVHGKGIYTFNAARSAFEISATLALPAGWSVADIVQAQDGKSFWIATNPGLAYYDGKTGHLNYRDHNPDKNRWIEDLKDQRSFFNLFHHQGDELWYSSWPVEDGAPFAYRYNTLTGEKTQFSIGKAFGFNYFELLGSLRQSNGRLWFYGRSFIAEFIGGEQPFRLLRNEYKDEQSIKFDIVHNMYEDRQRNVWVSTENGAFLFNPDAQSFNSYIMMRPDGSGSIDGPALSIIQQSDNQFLLGSWGSGLYAYDSNFNPVTLPGSLLAFKEPLSVWHFLKHSRTGLIWMGMQDGGMVVFDELKNKADKFYHPVFKSTIRQVVEDHEGNIYFGMQGGHIVKYPSTAADPLNPSNYILIRKRDAALVQKLFIDREGFLWAGTLTQGLYKYDTKTDKELAHITKFGPPGKNLWNNSPCDILQYNDSLLLIAGGAINFLNTKTLDVRQFTSAEGLPSNTTLCFERDNKGTVWLGMAHGLYRMNFEKRIFSQYDRRDGISYDNFNPAAAYKLKGGRLVFTTDHSFIEFNPDHIPAPPKPGTALITGLKIANSAISVDSVAALPRLVLKYDNTSIVIEFSSMNYMKQNKIHYHYKLEGVDKDWQESTEINQAVYNYLRPGNYVFRVKAENSDGVTSETETSLQIQVNSPFWRTWWFYGGLILLLFAILYYVDRERVKRLLALQQMRTQIAGDLHSEVSTTLNNIHLLSEMAKIKADKDLDRSKEYIGQISVKSQRMIIAMDDMLWSIDPGNDSMEMTLLRMEEFADALRSRDNASIKMETAENVKSLRLDMKVRHEFFLFFKEVLRHLAQYSEGSETRVDIDLSGNKLSLKFLQNGTSIKLDNIAEIRNRADALNADLDIQSDSKRISVILTLLVKQR